MYTVWLLYMCIVWFIDCSIDLSQPKKRVATTHMFACVEKNLFSKYICKYVANNLQFGKTVREKGKSDDLCFFVIIKGLDT